MFENIYGNKNIIDVLIDTVNKQKILHSYLFLGTEGIGKKIIAKEFAKMILCTGNNKYCNICKSCIEFDTSNNPDFKIIEPDGNSLKIDQIREFQYKVSEKPIISNRKVYIINDSDKMTIEAQNSLLKTIEEPPEFVTIILIGSNENAFLNTIKSRCMIMHFNNILDEDIKEYLRINNNIKIENESMIKAFQGSIGKAIQIIDKKEDYEKIENILKEIETKDIVDVLNMAENIYKSKEEYIDKLDYMSIILLDLAKKNNKYAKCIEIVENTKRRIQSNANFDMNIDNMLLNIWEQVN